MAKDAKGHGSNSRGGSYTNIDKNLRGPGRHVGYANGSWHISKSGRGYQATHQQTNAMLFSDSLGGMSKKLSDLGAAQQLASGPKSAPAPVHEAMRTPLNEPAPRGGSFANKPGRDIWAEGVKKIWR